jgi:hypothetical protein
MKKYNIGKVWYVNKKGNFQTEHISNMDPTTAYVSSGTLFYREIKRKKNKNLLNKVKNIK